MADGALNYALSLSSGGFVSGLSSAASSIGSFISRASALAAPLAAITGGVGALGAAMKSLSAAADMESIVVQMGVLTGGADKAKRLLDELRAMGAATPYEFPALATGAQTMLAFGIETEQILPLVKMLGDISAGSADKLSSLTLVLGQVASAGRLTGGDLLQFINAGFNPLVQIAARTGEKMEDLRKRMEEGGIAFREVQQALVDATSAGGSFFQMMDKMSATTSGKVSTLKDELNALFLAFGTPVNDAIKPILDDAITRVSQLQPMIATIGDAAATGLSRVYAAASSGQLGALIEAELKYAGASFLNHLSSGMNGLYNSLSPIGDYLAQAMASAGQIFKGALLDAVGTFASAFADLQAGILEKIGLKGAADALRALGGDAKDRFAGEGATETDAGKGALSTAWEKVIKSVGSGQAVSSEEMAAFRADRDETRIRLDRQIRTEAVQRRKAAEEAAKLAEQEAECTDAAREHQHALDAATSKIVAFQPVAPSTPSPSPLPGIERGGDFGAESGESTLGRALKGVDASRRSRWDRMSKADRAKHFNEYSEFEASETKGSTSYLRRSRITGIGESNLLEKRFESDALAKGSRAAREAGATINPQARALGDSNRAAKEKPTDNRDLSSILRKIEENTAAFAEIAVA